MVYFSILKKWIGNQTGKVNKRSRKDEDRTDEATIIKRRKGERNLSAQNVFYSRLARQGILKSSLHCFWACFFMRPFKVNFLNTFIFGAKMPDSLY